MLVSSNKSWHPMQANFNLLQIDHFALQFVSWLHYIIYIKVCPTRKKKKKKPIGSKHISCLGTKSYPKKREELYCFTSFLTLKQSQTLPKKSYKITFKSKQCKLVVIYTII